MLKLHYKHKYWTRSVLLLISYLRHSQVRWWIHLPQHQTVNAKFKWQILYKVVSCINIWPNFRSPNTQKMAITDKLLNTLIEKKPFQIGYTKVCNHPQLSVTTHNIRNHPQPSATIHNHSQSPATIHNHPQLPKKPSTAT